jgi:hypothetical protein
VVPPFSGMSGQQTMNIFNSVGRLCRALGPFVVGAIFSVGVSFKFPFFGFWILSSLYLSSFLLLLRMTPLER